MSENPGPPGRRGLPCCSPQRQVRSNSRAAGGPPDGVGQHQPDERVRGEVARPVGGAAEPGQPGALVGVEEVDETGAPSGSTGAAHHTTHATR